MTASTLSIVGRDAEIELSEHEIARGLKLLKQQLAELQRCSPIFVLMQNLSPDIPIASVVIETGTGRRAEVTVDPLKLCERLGVPRPRSAQLPAEAGQEFA